MTRGAKVVASAGLWALSACGGPDFGGSGDTTGPMPWWDTTGSATLLDDGPDSVSASAGGTSASTTTATTDPDEGSDDGEETAAEPDEVGFWGWAIVEPGVSFMGMEGEFVAFVGGEERCLIFWDYESGTPNDTCAECEFAFDVVRTMPEVEIDEGCSDYLDPAAIPTMISLGYADEILYMDDGRGWAPVGEAEFLPDEGNELSWFVPIE